MFKQILVPATGAATDAPVFATALAVSRLFGAHIEFLHARPDPMDGWWASPPPTWRAAWPPPG